MFRKNKVYVTMNQAELWLARIAMISFRNELIRQNKPTEDVDRLIIRLSK